jgi:hypothetical protein
LISLLGGQRLAAQRPASEEERVEKEAGIRSNAEENEGGMSPVDFIPALFLAGASCVAIFSGYSMLQLRRYRLCMLGSMAVMASVVGLPIGIWTLMTLRQPGMRSAFRRNEEKLSEESR